MKYSISAKKLFANKESVLTFFLSLVLTLLYCYGDYVVFDESADPIRLIKYLIVFVIYFVLIRFLYFFINNHYIKSENRIALSYGNGTFQLYVCVFLLIAWFPHLVIKYPIANHYDSYYQLRQGLGIDDLSSHWPIFYTLLLTFFYKTGDLFGSHNAGMFVFAAVKEMVHAYVASFILLRLRNSGISKRLLYLYIVFFSFSPIVSGYIGTTSKDADYAFFVTLLSLMLFEYARDNENFWSNKKNIVMLIVSSSFTILLRKNGIYLYILCALVIVIKEIAKKRMKNVKIVCFSVFLPLLFITIINQVLKPIPGSAAEMLSLPFQQTARLSKYHPELISEEEKTIINKVLPYSKLADSYKWYISDPVKSLYKQDATPEDLLNYLGVWMKCFFKSPITYIEATLSQNIYLLYPRVNDFRYYIECNNYQAEDQNNGLLQTPLWIKNKQGIYEKIMWFQHELPIFGQLNNVVTYNILLISLFFYQIIKKNAGIMVMLPSLISFIFCIIGPAIIANTRYCFPIVYSFPVWLSFCVISSNEKNA